MSANPPTQTTSSTVADLRRDRRRRLVLRLGIAVVLPTFLATIYLAFVATPQFESTSIFTIHSSEGPQATGLGMFLGTLPSTGTTRDALLVRQYILSRDMLTRLSEDYGYLEHYAKPDADSLSRLPEDGSSEEIFEYYLEHVDVDHDVESGVVTVLVRAFSGEDAHRLAAAILAESEAMVNRVSDESRRDSLQFAEGQLQAAEERLTAARMAVVQLQREGADINPMESAGAVISLRGGLESELAQARAELRALSSTMQPTAPRVVAQRQRVSGLAGQVAAQNRRLADESGQGLSGDIARFEPLVLEKEFAQQAYQSALASLELARAEADRQHRYVVRIAGPSQPDEFTHPSVGRGILTVFLLSFAMLGIGTLLLAALREHAKV